MKKKIYLVKGSCGSICHEDYEYWTVCAFDSKPDAEFWIQFLEAYLKPYKDDKNWDSKAIPPTPFDIYLHDNRSRYSVVEVDLICPDEKEKSPCPLSFDEFIREYFPDAKFTPAQLRMMNIIISAKKT